MASPAPCDWLRIITYFVGISNNDKGKNDQDSHPGPYNLRLIGYQNERRYIGKFQVSAIWTKTALQWNSRKQHNNEFLGNNLTNTGAYLGLFNYGCWQ